MPVDPSGKTPEPAAIDLSIRIGLLFLFVAIVALLVHPFLSILIWSVTLTVALYPVFVWIRDRLGGRGIPAAVVVTLLSVAIIVGPIGLLSASLVESMLRLAEAVSDRTLNLSSLLPADVSSIPVVGADIQAEWTEATTNTADFFKRYGHTMLAPSEWLLKMVASLAGSTLVFAFAILVAGFLFVPAPHLVRMTRDIAVRTVGPRGAVFVDIARATIRNVSRGIIGIAVLQALIVGVVLLVMKVPHAGLLTSAVLILAIVQIGTSAVILPLIVWIWVTRDFGSALGFSVAMLPVAAAEHLLKPIVLGKGLKTPTLAIAIGVLGGLFAFGLPGLFIGPITLAVFSELIVLWVWPDNLPESAADDDGSKPSPADP